MSITLEMRGDVLTIRLADDGEGFPSAGPVGADWPHYGLEAMRERATAIGGSIEWSSAPDSGTIVELTVPLARFGGEASPGHGGG